MVRGRGQELKSVRCITGGATGAYPTYKCFQFGRDGGSVSGTTDKVCLRHLSAKQEREWRTPSIL